MTRPDKVMLTFHDRDKKRYVYFCMEGSNNVMFTFNDTADSVMFTFPGRVKQRDVYFP